MLCRCEKQPESDYLSLLLQNLLHCFLQYMLQQQKEGIKRAWFERDPEIYSMHTDSCSIPCLLKLFQIDSCFQDLSERSSGYEICLAGFYHDKNRFYLGYNLFNRSSNMILAIALWPPLILSCKIRDTSAYHQHLTNTVKYLSQNSPFVTIHTQNSKQTPEQKIVESPPNVFLRQRFISFNIIFKPSIIPDTQN